MNRRSFLKVAGATVAGFFFPHLVEVAAARLYGCQVEVTRMGKDRIGQLMSRLMSCALRTILKEDLGSARVKFTLFCCNPEQARSLQVSRIDSCLEVNSTEVAGRKIQALVGYPWVCPIRDQSKPIQEFTLRFAELVEVATNYVGGEWKVQADIEELSNS